MAAPSVAKAAFRAAKRSSTPCRGAKVRVTTTGAGASEVRVAAPVAPGADRPGANRPSTNTWRVQWGNAGGRSAARTVRLVAAAAFAAGLNRNRSRARRLAYFQFSSREVGRPCAVRVSIAARRRAAAAPEDGSAPEALAYSSTMRVVRGVLMALSHAAAPDTQS